MSYQVFMPKANRQLNLFNIVPKRGRPRQRPRTVFGGQNCLNYNPASRRPMDSKKALHLVLRSTKAVGAKSLKNKVYEERVFAIVQKHAKLNAISLYEYANGGNHLHILMR